MERTEVAYHEAVEVVRQCCGPVGLKASASAAGYHEVWARDSMITALGARYIPDPVIQDALRASVSNLKMHQSSIGSIPNFINETGEQANFRAYADSGLWWLIGSANLAPDPQMSLKVLHWYEHQDVDRSGVISMQEASDWQDLLCTRGKGLSLNCLYVLALRATAKLFHASETEQGRRCLKLADKVAERVNRLFWYGGDGNMLPHIAHTFSTMDNPLTDSLGRRRWIPTKHQLTGEQYYLPYLGFRTAGEWFDTLGNLLAVLAGVARDNETRVILDFISRHRLDTHPVCCLTPAIQPGDADWRDYYYPTNQPHHYHNGGIWPFIGGIYTAALVKAGRLADAAEALSKLAETNLRGKFNEWHHGESGEPMGVEWQAWSAGCYLLAFECVRTQRVELV